MGDSRSTWPTEFQGFIPKHGTAERWDVCDCIDCRRATGRPLAPAIRRELAALLKAAADKAEEWANAADCEWAPHAPDYHDGDGTVTAAIEAPYVEHRLAMAWRGQVRRMADNLSADERAQMADTEALRAATFAAAGVLHEVVPPWTFESRKRVRECGQRALDDLEPGTWLVRVESTLDAHERPAITVARKVQT